MKLAKKYDFIIIGSGFGGAMSAYKLMSKGYSVLIIEKGKRPLRDDSCWDEVRLHLKDPMYRSSTPFYVDQKNGKIETMWSDDTVGGMSTLYGAVSFRMREDDFNGPPLADKNERDLSCAWPYSYKDIAPYYSEAEKLLGIAGEKGSDITEPPIKGKFPQRANAVFSRPSKKLWKSAQDLGLHPFLLPMAINFDGKHGKGQCIRCSTCDHYLCKIEAKNDLSVAILPHLESKGVTLLSQSRALKINTVKNRAVSVDIANESTGEIYTIKADNIICSGGALYSPYILLCSKIDEITGNKNIGHYLMRHINGVVAGVFPSVANPDKILQKQIGIPDFYFGDPEGKRKPYGPWGMIQDVSSIGKGVIKANSPAGLKNIAAFLSDYLINLLCIAEDTPNYNNRVFINNSAKDNFGMPTLHVYHRYSKRDIMARNALYKEAKRILRNAGALLFYSMPIETFSHALGTCRMGLNPETSVVDENCKVHGMKNLYVIDGSAMPSGGSVNPSLTIAALALKAADSIS